MKSLLILLLISLLIAFAAVWTAREGKQNWSPSILIGIGIFLAALGTFTSMTASLTE